MPGMAPITDANPTVDDMEARVAPWFTGSVMLDELDDPGGAMP